MGFFGAVLGIILGAVFVSHITVGMDSSWTFFIPVLLIAVFGYFLLPFLYNNNFICRKKML